MVRTGGTLKPKLINLIGQLDQDKTLKNINKDITALEKRLRQEDKKLKIDVELFGNVKDIAKNISDLQKKLEASSSFKDIKVGVALEDVNVKDINEQIEKVQKKFNEAKTANKLKLDVEFDFTGSASKIKEEMEGIRQFMARYGEQMKNMDIINLDKDAENAKKNAGGIKTSIQTMGQGIDKVSNEIEADMRKMTTSSGKFGVTFERDINGAIKGATGTLTNANGVIDRFKYNVDDTSGSLVHMSTNTKVAGDQAERYQKTMSELDKAQKDFNKALASAPHDKVTRDIQATVESQKKYIEEMRKTGEVTDKGSEAINVFKNATRDLKTQTENLKIKEEFEKAGKATRDAVEEFKRLGGAEADVKKFENAIEGMSNGATGNMNKLEAEVREATRSMIDDANRLDKSLSKIDSINFKTAIQENDIKAVKRYVEQIEGAEVASVRFTQRKDKMGNAIDKVAVNMKEADGAVKSYAYDLNNADGSIRKVSSSTKELTDSNKGLENGFKQILGRITQYFGAMQLVQQSMRGFREIYREIRAVDEQMIELARVADPSLNLESVLTKSIGLSKELGASVTDVLGVVGDMARTFGEFNEAQLLAITRTATIMTNVSDFSLKESGETLVGTMKAFNITAEDSIRIVNVLNEVDNNYAISTHQLGNAISRAGATASVFGANLEEISGHITAVGAVTQESGERIGTALRTIYSRITTHKDSIEILNNLGIAMHEMGNQGPQLRSVSDILGDLAEEWKEMSREQQQNTALAIAGRNRLTQFIALMNNYKMATDATTTAMNSQGSAMREQEQYMQSYEYQFTVLGASASELALVIEDRLVGDAIYLLVDSAITLVEVFTDLIDKFGVLPTILVPVAGAFLLMDGNFKKTIDNLQFGLTAIGEFAPKLKGLTDTIVSATTGMGKFGSLLVGGGIALAIGAIGFAIEKLIGHIAEQKRVTEEALRSMDTAVESYNSHGREIGTLIDRYEELDKKRRRTNDSLEVDEQREYNNLINEISAMLPATVSHVDAQGQAHLKSSKFIREQVSALEQLALANQEIMTQSSQATYSDIAETFFEAEEGAKKVEAQYKTTNAILHETYEEFVARMKQANITYSSEANALQAYENRNLANTAKAYQENASIYVANEYKKSEALKETILTVGDTAVAHLEAEGVLANTSTSAQALIRDFASYNEELINTKGTQKDFTMSSVELEERNIRFGEIIAGVYDGLAKGVKGIDTSDAITQFDNLLASIPSEIFEIDMSKDLDDEMDRIAGHLTAVSSIIGQVASDAELDVESLVSTLERAGIESGVAREIVMNLGVEFDNQSVKTAIAQEELAQYNDELVDLSANATEAFNPLDRLFGLDSGVRGGLESHIQYLQLLRQQYGDTWKTMDMADESLQSLADYFGQSTDFVVQNIDMIEKALRAIAGASTDVSEETGRTIMKFGDDVDDETRRFLNNMLQTGEGFAGFSNQLVIEMGYVEKSQEELAKMTEELDKKFKNFMENPSDGNEWQLLLSTLNEQLEDLAGSYVLVGDEAEGFKLAMADGSESEYLNTLNQQLEDSNLKLTEVYDSETNMHKLLISGPEGEELITLSSMSQLADEGALAIDTAREALKGLKDEGTSDENRDTFLAILNNQLDYFGDGIQQARDENGKLKNELEFSDGTSNTWVDGINKAIKDLNLSMEVTKDKNGELQLVLKNEAGETIFTSTAGQIDEMNEKVDEADKKVDNFANKERNPVKLTIDDEDFNTAIDENDGRLDVITQEQNYVPLGLDDHEFDIEAEKAKIKADELEQEKIMQLKLNIDEEGFNVTVEKVSDLRLELMDIDQELVELERILRATNEQMGGLMTNTENINNARNAIISLKDDVDEAIIKMGELYEKFASGGIDTSGFQTDANAILSTVAGVEENVRRLQRAVASLNSTMGALNQSFDISPMVAYRAGMAVHATGIESRMNELNGVVRTAFNAINSTLSNVNRQLENATARTSDSLGKMTVLYRMTKEMVVRYIEDMGVAITDDYTDTVVSILATTLSFNKSMNIAFSAIGTTVRDQMQLMGKDMISVFKSSTDSIVSTAQGLPSRIGNGITANMSSATNSMTSLAKNMVSRFKAELGIRSPSRVFESLGGDVIDGLVNGLSGSDITNLGQSVFSDFSAGAISTIDQIKGYMEFSPISAGSFGGAFSMTSGFGPRKSPGGIGSTNHRGVDFGAPMGTAIPSQSSGRVVASGWMGGLGNAVIIESAGGVQHVYGHNSANYVSVGQTVGRGQAIGAVGSTGQSTGPHVHYEVRVNGVAVDPRKRLRGFAKGGFVDSEELAFVGEEGLEAIIPLMPHRKERGLDLWAETGEILGMNSSLLEMLIRSQRRSGSFSSGGGFSGLDGEAGGGETATATSGTIAPDYSSIMRSLGTADKPMFSGMATSNDREQMEDLYKRDMHAINVGRFSSMLTKANTELTALMENTLKYRNALEEVNYQERKLRDATQQQLNASIKRQSQIEKELGKLRNTSKHTVDQRKKYNELQQEFDRNSESIMSMENEIRKLNISMDQRKVEIYTDYIGQLTKGFEDLTNAIDKTISDMQFSLDYLTLTDENNIGAQLKIQYDVLRESIRLENTLMNNVNKLQAEYSKAVSKYGKDSQQALLARDELYKSESAYQSSVLDRVKLEQSVAKTREDVANEGIDTLKSYYKQTQTMTERAIELERKALEKHHENKMSMYDDEIAKIESIYDTRIAEMDAKEAEDAYNETISDLNTQRAELMQQISRASRDTSLEGRKRLAELQSELGEVNSEIATTQKDRQDQMYREAIERQKQEQIEAVEMQKERAEMEQEIRLESLDQQLADAQNYAERMINDEAMWERLRSEFIVGNGTGLASMTNEMTEQMSRFMSGDFRAVSMGYSELSDEDKDLFSEDTLLEISNLMLQSSESMERFVSTANENVQNIGRVAGRDYNVGAMTTSSGGSISTKATTGPNIPPAPKPAPKPVADNRTYTIKRGDTLWDLAQKYYGNPYQWTKIAQANTNPDPRKLQIGRKLIIPFDTGGYTGDWMGDEGRVALLHKKELVLNESQTRDILNVAKIVDKISGFIPRINASKPNLGSGSITNTGDNYNLETLVLEIPDFKGDEKDARRVFDNMAKSLKKLGK